MTDNEIIQALKCCVSDDDCNKCPCYKINKFGCTNSQFTRDILNLIKRQQTENKRLKELLNKWKTEAYKCRHFVEVVRCKDCRHYNTSCCNSGLGWCEFFNTGATDEHFCGHGERRGA